MKDIVGSIEESAPSTLLLAARRLWLWVVAAGHLFFIAMTVLGEHLPGASRNGILQAFNLASETNLAAWWSAMNLLVLGLLAAEIAVNETGKVRLAWAGLSLLLALLSLDEIGSLHERAGGFGGLIPYIAAAVILLALCLVWLFGSSNTRPASLWIGAGFFLFGLVILQERIEHILVWPAWASGLRVGAEEGSELLGMGLILWGELNYRRRLTGNRFLAPPDPQQIPALLFLVGLGVHLLTLLPHQQAASTARWGDPGLWFPSAAFFALGLAALAAGWEANKNISWLWLVLAALFLFSSAAYVYLLVPRPEGSRLASLGWATSLSFFLLCQTLLAGFLIWIRDRAVSGWALLGYILLIGAAASAWLWKSVIAHQFLAGVVSVTLGWLAFRRALIPATKASIA